MLGEPGPRTGLLLANGRTLWFVGDGFALRDAPFVKPVLFEYEDPAKPTQLAVVEKASDSKEVRLARSLTQVLLKLGSPPAEPAQEASAAR